MKLRWRNSDSICALADRERHLGHIVRIAKRWYAFDGTKINQTEDGFRSIGSFATAVKAREAVEFETTGAKWRLTA